MENVSMLNMLMLLSQAEGAITTGCHSPMLHSQLTCQPKRALWSIDLKSLYNGVLKIYLKICTSPHNNKYYYKWLC